MDKKDYIDENVEKVMSGEYFADVKNMEIGFRVREKLEGPKEIPQIPKKFKEIFATWRREYIKDVGVDLYDDSEFLPDPDYPLAYEHACYVEYEEKMKKLGVKLLK